MEIYKTYYYFYTKFKFFKIYIISDDENTTNYYILNDNDNINTMTYANRYCGTISPNYLLDVTKIDDYLNIIFNYRKNIKLC